MNANKDSKPLKVGVRSETREKLDRIAADRRWTLAETVDALADYFIEGEQPERARLTPEPSTPDTTAA